MNKTTLRVGDATFSLECAQGLLLSLGAVSVKGTPLRNPRNRFLPWFDTYNGDVFRQFRLLRIERKARRTVIHTRAVSDPDVLFQERRDSSGDICLRPKTWDSEPLETDFRIVLEPAAESIDGRNFTGFRYWFEYRSRNTPIHRLVDRQTWEIGGDLSDVHVVCRNLFDLPMKKVTRPGSYSTVGLNHWAGALPGNLWARWSLLPAFDMEYGRAGVMVGWFDRVACIRSVIESMPGEDWVRYVDLHYFENSGTVRTTPKTILFCADVLDEVDAMNLWTRVHDREQAKACAQFGMRQEEPPAIILSQNVWTNFQFDTTYNHLLEAAATFGADYIFIDSVWQNMETYHRTLRHLVGKAQFDGSVLEKLHYANMCCSLDFEVSGIAGGEEGLKRFCARARSKGVKVISWMAAHVFGAGALTRDRALGHGANGILAAKESGHHPDTGYPVDCQTLNLNAPIYDRLRKQVLGVCRRTGLAGYLWDSFSNLGWWQIDYSKGDMRPQFDKMARLYADMVNAGLYIAPEAVVSFSNHSCCGLHGGNVYAGPLMGYAYNTGISLHYAPAGQRSADQTGDMLRGRKPIDELFQAIAHKRVPGLDWTVPRREWDPDAVRRIKDLFATYKAVRRWMQKRTVLKKGAGVLWEAANGKQVLFSFKHQRRDGRTLEANTVYVL